MRVLVDENAAGDIDALAAWIAKDSPASARAVASDVLAVIKQLAQFPRIGHVGREAGTYERGVRGTPYIVVYEIRDQPSAVVVISIMHGARER